MPTPALNLVLGVGYLYLGFRVMRQKWVIERIGSTLRIEREGRILFAGDVDEIETVCEGKDDYHLLKKSGGLISIPRSLRSQVMAKLVDQA